MNLRRKELDYLKNELTWREFADAAGAKVLVRGLARGSSRKIPTKTMKQLQLRIAGTMSDTGAKAMVHDALTVISRALAKNGPHLTDRVMAKNAKKAKVSKRLQKQVKEAMAHKAA
jgi:hypothetical protein